MGIYDTRDEHKLDPFHAEGGRPGAGHGAHPESTPHSSTSYSGPTHGAVPGAYSPAADTVVDARDTYMANKAGFDAKWSGSELLERALARHRGEKVEDRPIKPELGAPTHTRPLASPEAVMASAHAASAPASHIAPAPSTPAPSSSGPSERDVYLANQQASDARAQKDVFLQRALERYRKK